MLVPKKLSTGRPLFVCLQSFDSELNWKNNPYGKGKKKVKKNQMVKFIYPSAPVTVTEYVKRDPLL